MPELTIKELKELTWEIDDYYLRIAKVVSERSKCLSRKIGSVLVKDDRIIGTGFNSPAPNVPHCEYRDNEGKYVQSITLSNDKNPKKIKIEPVYTCPRQRMGFKSGEGLDFCVAVHSEINSILSAARNGISTIGTTLYCYCGHPCINCTKEIITAGVKRVVCIKDTEYNQKLSSLLMFEQAGVDLVFHRLEG
jgi:dCMP deaminase